MEVECVARAACSHGTRPLSCRPDRRYGRHGRHGDPAPSHRPCSPNGGHTESRTPHRFALFSTSPRCCAYRGGPPCPSSTRLLQPTYHPRSEEHTSELQSQSNLVCRLLLEKKKTKKER